MSLKLLKSHELFFSLYQSLCTMLYKILCMDYGPMDYGFL